jgi:hypothetical protein
MSDLFSRSRSPAHGVGHFSSHSESFEGNYTRLGGGDSTDAFAERNLSTGEYGYPGDSADGIRDSADATRGYPEDSTDETNSLNLIPFN